MPNKFARLAHLLCLKIAFCLVGSRWQAVDGAPPIPSSLIPHPSSLILPLSLSRLLCIRSDKLVVKEIADIRSLLNQSAFYQELADLLSGIGQRRHI